MSRTTTVAVITCVLAGACAELPDVDRGVCGNLVVEPGEDCDGFAGEGQACAAAGSVSECRFECADAACPDGWGCGLDGVCRRGGDFAEAPLGPWTYDGVTMDGADVDGDGRVDVIGVGPAGIGARFSSADGRLDDHADLPMRVMGPTAVGDVNADGRADVVAPIDIGMLAYTGSPERRLDAVPFALFGEDQTVGELRVAAVGAVPDFLPITYPALITDGGMCFVQFCDALGGAVNPPDGFDLAAMFPAVRAELDGGLTGEEMLLASDGNSNLYVYDIERVTTADGDIDRPRLRQTLALPGPARTRPQLMKRDLDNHWDLIIGVDVGGELKVAAAPGNAGGGFDAAAVDTKFDQFQSAGCGSSRMPLVAADFTGDNAIEWVGDLAVCVDLPIFGFVPYAVPRGASVLREAVAVDLNRDGANDLVAAYQDIDGLAVFLGGGGLLFNQTTVVTEFPVHDLRVGDYDGNYIDDVAFVRPAGLAADAGDEVAVLFGSSDGVADGTVRMAAFGTIEDLLPLDLIISLSTLDRATDMLVVSRHPVTGARGGGALFGDPSGRMTSPLIVDGATPLGALIGRFQDPGATATFILRGLPPDSSAHPPFTTFDVIALTNEGEQFRVEGSPQTLSVSGFAPACAIAAAGDFDGDGLDELVMVDRPADGELCARDPERPAALDDARVAAIDPGAGGGADVATAAGLARPGAMAIADLDLDGDDDVVIPFVGVDGAGQGLMVLRGDNGAGLPVDGERPELIDGVRAAAVVDTDPGLPPALALIAGDQLWLAAADGAGSWQAPVPIGSLDAEGVASALVAGDVDGDGLADLVVLRGGRVWVWLRQPGPLVGDLAAAAAPGE